MLSLNIVLAAAAFTGPPHTPTDPVAESVHGVEIVDPYRWLEQLDSESDHVEAWTTSQNEYTRSVLDNAPNRRNLENRLGELLTLSRATAPKVRGDQYFNLARTGDQNQYVMYVRSGLDGPPRELLNPNTIDDMGLTSIDWFDPSHDGSLLAFGTSEAGNEMPILNVMKVETGRWLSDQIEGKVGFAGWMPDASGFVYTRLLEPNDPYSRAICYHELGMHPREDDILFVQREPEEIPSAMLSQDGRWIILQLFNGWSRQNLYAINIDDWRRTGEAVREPVAVNLGARFEAQAVVGDTLYIMTTLNAPHGCVYAVDLTNTSQDAWQLIIPQRDDAVLKSVSYARGLLAAGYIVNASSQIRLYSARGDTVRELELPGTGSASLTTELDRSDAFLNFMSFDQPRSIYHVSLKTGKRTLWAAPEVPIDPEQIEVHQLWYSSKDGTQIPMFVVHRQGIRMNGRNPCVLYGYGGFNQKMLPYFSASLIPWIQDGGVYAIANLRGGGEYGDAWHEAGMLDRKQNVFDDFIAAAEHLIDQNYTTPEHLACRGGSNGGLLVGAVAVQRPDLFAAVICQVPLLDMVRYHKFLMARFWIPEYGDPDQSEDFEWLYDYSPYHHVEQNRKYPAMLITAGENDNRVHPLHARKMAARLQSAASNDHTDDPILLWVDRESGHGSGKPLRLRIREAADIWSFTAWQTGLQYGESN